MAIGEIHLRQGNVLNKMTAATVIVPERMEGPFPVLYLLHGLSDDHTAWARRSRVESYVEDLPLIVVMPNGERSFYTDSRSNPKAAFETFMTRDLIGWVDATYRTIPERAGRVIAGLSMGGYGALKLALKHPDLYRAAVSHSGAVEFASAPFADRDEQWRLEYEPVFGENPQGGPEDVFALAEQADRETMPALRIDCGVDDFLIEHNRRLHEHLLNLNVPHEYAEFPGAHTWEYWDTHIQDALIYFARELGIERVPAD